MNPKIDQYLADGCGRCSLYKTDQCKVHTYAEELVLLRSLVLECGLQEELKWSQPCYTFEGKNMFLVTAFKDFACLSIFNGALLSDPHKLLEPAGPNTQSVRLAKFTNPQDLKDNLENLRAYIFESIEISKSGIKVEKKKEQDPIPPELQDFFDKDPEFQASFESLTPGRQRGYLLHFNAAKKSETRISRIEKYYDKIISGIGFHDR